jgi:hypothetical protein
MTTRSIFILLFGFTITISFAQIGAKAHPQSAVTGTWSSMQFGFEMVLMLNPDNTGEFDGAALTYVVTGNTIVLKSEGVETTYQFELKTDQLTLSGGDLDSKVTFTRNTQNKDTDQATATIEKTTSGITETPSIIGSWSGGGEVLEFKKDGQCMLSGQAISYQFNPPFIEFNGPGGSMKIETSFTDKDHMNLNVNGNLVPYTRVGNTPINAPGQTNTSSESSGGQIDMSMVGKWCYTNINSYNQGSSYSSNCITLNADGTYVYVNESERSVNTSDFSGGTAGQGNDAGKWWVQGDRIYYNSPTKGQGSFHFEKRNHPKNVGDPMLVIEGTAYVTAYAKAPW